MSAQTWPEAAGLTPHSRVPVKRTLSRRESEILDRVAADPLIGREELAEAFGVTDSTMKHQVASIYRKLGVAGDGDRYMRFRALAAVGYRFTRPSS